MKFTRDVKKPSARAAPVQVAIVFMFTISVFANIGIMLHANLKEHSRENADNLPSIPPDPSYKSRDNPGLDGILTKNGTQPKKHFLRSLAKCINKRINDTDSGKSPLFSLSAFKNVFLPPRFLDDDTLKSMSWTMQQIYRQERTALQGLSKPVIKAHNFNYIHNPKYACANRKIDVVFAVLTAPENFEYRNQTRRGLKGSYCFETSNNATLLFFTGKSNHPNKSRRFQMEVNMEIRRFGDIVQEEFLDEYKNETLKSMSVLKWVSTFCPHAKYVIRTADNAGVKPAAAVSALKRHRKRFGNFIVGKWNKHSLVQRDKTAKNYVSMSEYPYPRFPPHLLGGALGFPVSTAKMLYQLRLRVKPLWLDDVFLTGICAPMLDLPLLADLVFDFKLNTF